ncbi:glycoside hydrolase family 172 protein [Planctomycetes bacterium CA13]
MVDRDSVARFPENDFRLRQDSSYNRASKTPEDTEGWFNNFDRNTDDRHHNFIRIEENHGRKEWVVMEHEGPGVLTRFWAPWRSQTKAETNITLRFYLDGDSEPALEGNMFDLFQGNGLIPFPLAHQSLRSAVSFFPIPYAKGCKVTMSDHPFFFQFTYRDYADDVNVKSFTMDDFHEAKATIDSTCKSLLDPRLPRQGEPISFNQTLAPGAEHSIDLPGNLHGSEAAIRKLSLKLADDDDPAVTRSVVLKINFDGKETVWCPIGDFFGSGIGLNPLEGWYRTVTDDGTMTCRWVMPYQTSAAVSLVNLGEMPVDAQLNVNVSDWQWDDRSMYFHAGWRGQYPVATRPYSDWNYITTKGRGVYVGDTLTIMNPVEKWWGEGDEKIWIDGEEFPSIFGTGTEDYYGYSWGGVSTDFYEHPFHAQPRSNVYNKLNRKTTNERNTQGYSVETRTRSLDTIPFASSLQLDMEVWSWSDCDMGYGVGAYWYGFADTTSNRKPDAAEVLNVPPLPDTDAAQTTSTFKNAVEINAEIVISKSDNIVLRPQNLKRLKLKGSWNLDNQLLFKNAQIGDVVEIRIPASSTVPAKSPAAETLTLHATKAQDYGILNFSVNGKPVGKNVDFFTAEKATSYRPIVLGTFNPVDSVYVLRVEVVGKNPKSKGALFGLDCVSIGPADGPADGLADGLADGPATPPKE